MEVYQAFIQFPSLFILSYFSVSLGNWWFRACWTASFDVFTAVLWYKWPKLFEYKSNSKMLWCLFGDLRKTMSPKLRWEGDRGIRIKGRHHFVHLRQSLCYFRSNYFHGNYKLSFDYSFYFDSSLHDLLLAVSTE